MFLGWEYWNELENWMQNCLFQGKEELFLHPQNVVVACPQKESFGSPSVLYTLQFQDNEC